ncbi:MAG: cell division ATP-binding protein FtsE [Armatimonadetes bacterium]|nr:cell division ATP-binding protein FtsE [Armatimonadota bacterium]
MLRRAAQAPRAAARQGPAILFEDVAKRYPAGVEALRGVTLRIDPGEFVFIVGPTGAGKSTLLRLIYRDEVPTRGRVVVNGWDTARLPAALLPHLRRSVGIVFQDFKLLPRKTVSENIEFVLRVTGVPREEIPARVQVVLEQVGLLHRASAFPSQISGGEQQRVSVARALANRPPILLADEPTGNLDPSTSWEIIQLLSAINLHGTTVVVATHNNTLVDILRRRVVQVADGTVVRDELRGLYAHEA